MNLIKTIFYKNQIIDFDLSKSEVDWSDEDLGKLASGNLIRVFKASTLYNYLNTVLKPFRLCVKYKVIVITSLWIVTF